MHVKKSRCLIITESDNSRSGSDLHCSCTAPGTFIFYFFACSNSKWMIKLQVYRWCIVSGKYKICRVFGIHLSTWTWNKGNNGDCSLLLILGLLSLHWQWKLATRLYDKRDDFNFPIVNFPFLSSNILSAPAYGIYVSQLIRYARACSNSWSVGKCSLQRCWARGIKKTKLVATFKKFYGKQHDLVNPYSVAVSRIVSDVFATDAP